MINCCSKYYYIPVHDTQCCYTTTNNITDNKLGRVCTPFQIASYYCFPHILHISMNDTKVSQQCIEIC